MPSFGGSLGRLAMTSESRAGRGLGRFAGDRHQVSRRAGRRRLRPQAQTRPRQLLHQLGLESGAAASAGPSAADAGGAMTEDQLEQEALGWLANAELTGQRKSRCFSYAGHVELLADGTGRGRERHMAERRAAHPHGFSHAAGLHATICDRTGRVGTSMKTTLDRSLGPADSGCRAGLAVRTGVASFETRRPGKDGTPVHASSRTKARRR